MAEPERLLAESGKAKPPLTPPDKSSNQTAGNARLVYGSQLDPH
ncbi:MAG: hypothetical protein AAGA83_18540 [Cyanobacteria bacterium P01_F01_bin.116]